MEEKNKRDRKKKVEIRVVQLYVQYKSAELFLIQYEHELN